MLEGIYCDSDYVEYDGYYWKSTRIKCRWGDKIYHTQVLYHSQPNKYKEQYLHRYVWSRYYDRKITRKKSKTGQLIIHHKNEDSLDNRIENLQLMTRGDHTKVTRENLKENPEAYKKKPMSEETKRKISKSMKGRKKQKWQIEAAQKGKREKLLERIKNQIDK
jgi:hypothetical protein